MSADERRGRRGEAKPVEHVAFGMDREAFEDALAEAFDATPTELRVVSRHARDLSDSGQYAEDAGHDLTPDTVVANLADAPAEHEALPAKWNWWMGSLELAYGGYVEFEIRGVEG